MPSIKLDTQTLNEELAAGATLKFLLGTDAFCRFAEINVYISSAMLSLPVPMTAPGCRNSLFPRGTCAKELPDSATLMPVIFVEDKVTVAPEAFPVFEPVDLNGNTVTFTPPPYPSSLVRAIRDFST